VEDALDPGPFTRDPDENRVIRGMSPRIRTVMDLMLPSPDRTATLEPRDAGAGEPCEIASPGYGARSNSEGIAEMIDAHESSWPSDDPGRYEQIAEHARGGLGRVVRAVDLRLRRTVAVKQLLRHDEGHERRFVREALITARLQHPGIVPVHEAGRWPNGEPYYVMKLVEGRTLKELIARTTTLRDRLALLPNVIAIADTIAYAHSEGVIHRDVKPANVVVGSFGETVVVDWGLAIDREDAPPQGAGAIVGTPAYMPPEQARGEAVDERADVYALGAALYELLAGAAPYSDASVADVLALVIAGPPTPLCRRACGVPRELAGIVAKAMARRREDRYADASAFADDLRRFQTGKLVRAHAYSPWQLARKKLAQHPRLSQVAFAALIATSTVELHALRTAPVAEACMVPMHDSMHDHPALPAVHVVMPTALHVRTSRHTKLPCHNRYVTVAGSQTGDDASLVKGS
jgi:hypothetical protein